MEYDPLPTPMEPEWEAALPYFPVRAIKLVHASVQRDLAARMRKVTLRETARNQAKMDLDQPSSSTLLAIIEKGIADALAKNGRPKAPKSANKRKGDSEYDSSSSEAPANTSLPKKDSGGVSKKKRKEAKGKGKGMGRKPRPAKSETK